MQQMIDEAGNIWNVDAQGNPVSFAGNANQQRGSGVQIKPADPTQQYAGPNAAADLRGQQLANEQKAQELANSQRGELPRGYRWGANGQAELIPGVPGPKGESGDSVRLANLRSVIDQINRIETLYNESQKGVGLGSIAEYFPTQENRRFDTAGAALADMGTAAFKVPGMGSQSDADAARFVQANQPSRWDSDSQVEEKLSALRRRVERNMEALGQPAPAWGGATVLPRAAGVQQSAPMKSDGVTAQGGLQPIPQLVGMENTVIDMIGRGADTGQVMGFLSQQLAPYDARPDEGTAAWVQGVIDRHNADPSKPVRSLGAGWELLHHRKMPDSEQSALGGFADTSLGTALMTGANAATGGLPAYLAGKQDVMNAAADERPGAAMTGEIAGGAAAMLGINRAAGALGKAGTLLTRGGGIGGDMAYGAGRGGLEGGPGGAVAGALAAGAGNKIGGGIASGTGAAVRGVSSPAVRYLADKGIPMTMGQMLGNRGVFGRTMNKLESVPLLGDALQGRRMEGVRAFNEEAFNQAVDPINGPMPGIGPDGIDAAQQAVGQAYADAYGGVNLVPDQQFAQQAAPFIQQGSQVPVMGEQFDYIMQNQVKPLGQGGTLDGPRLQAALQALKGARSSFVKEGAMGNAAADAVSGVEGAFNDMVARQAPDVLPKINAANAANRNVSTLSDAVMSNADGLFTPAQLRRAGINNTKKFGGRNAAARGDIPFKELVGYGQDVLPSTIPNSGTADRGLAAAILPAALGGSAVGAQGLGQPEVAVPLAVLAALTSKQGAKVAQKALTGRSNAARAIGTAIRKQKRRAGLFGAAAASSMVPQLPQ